jgi:hypothetical protein
MVLWNWIQNCCIWFEKWFEEYCVVFVLWNGFMKLDTKLLYLVWEMVWGLLCCICFMKWFYKIVVFGLRNGFMKLDTNCCIWFEKWFEKWFYEIGYKLLYLVWEMVWEMVLWNWIQIVGEGLRNIVLNLFWEIGYRVLWLGLRNIFVR